MLPPIVTTSIEHFTSTIISFVVIMLVAAFIAMLLARSFGGKSQLKRQLIFGIVSLGGVCAAGFYALSRLSGGG
jgi:hypothetical protein